MSATQPESSARLPLEGIRIVECGVWHAGPGGCAILGDLGAEVIKVESLQGDPERTHGRALGTVKFSGVEKEDWSLLYEMSNRNKRGISVDVASAPGREVLERLIRGADVFLTNFRDSTIRGLRLDHATLEQLNPRLIHTTVSGYGQHGELADVGGFDPMGQAISGMTFLTGSEQPIILQTIILDQITAITASHAILTALVARDRQGHGQALHVSLYGSAVWTLYANLMGSSILKKNLSVGWDRSISPPLRNMYRCQDGRWLIGTHHPEQKYWPAFARILGIEWMNDDARFNSPAARASNVRELIRLIDQAMLARPAAQWRAEFHANGLNFIPAQSYSEVLEDPQALANGYVVELDHPTMGRVRAPGYPVQFSRQRVRHAPAPERGEHTRAVLRELGYAEAEITAMLAAGAIHAPP